MTPNPIRSALRCDFQGDAHAPPRRCGSGPNRVRERAAVFADDAATASQLQSGAVQAKPSRTPRMPPGRLRHRQTGVVPVHLQTSRRRPPEYPGPGRCRASAPQPHPRAPWTSPVSLYVSRQQSACAGRACPASKIVTINPLAADPVDEKRQPGLPPVRNANVHDQSFLLFDSSLRLVFGFVSWTRRVPHVHTTTQVESKQRAKICAAQTRSSDRRNQDSGPGIYRLCR